MFRVSNDNQYGRRRWPSLIWVLAAVCFVASPAWAQTAVPTDAKTLLEQIKTLRTQSSELGFARCADRLDVLAEEGWGRWLENQAAFELVDPVVALDLIDEVNDRLTDDQKEHLLTIVRNRFIVAGDMPESLSPDAINELLWVVRQLGASDIQRSKTARLWLAHPGNLEQATARCLVGLSYALGRDAQYKSLQSQVAQAAWDQHLSDWKGFSDDPEDDLSGRLRLAGRFGYRLNRAHKQQLQEVLLELVVYDTTVLHALTPSDIRYLIRSLRAVHVPYTEINFVMAHWMDHSGKLKISRPRELQVFVDQLKRGLDLPSTQQARMNAATVMFDRYLSDPVYLKRYATVDELSWAVRVLGRVWNPVQQKRFARLYYRVLLLDSQREAEPSLRELATLGKILHNAEMDTGGLPYDRYAQAVAGAFASGQRLGDHFYWEAKFTAAPLRSLAGINHLKAILVNSDGQVNVDVGQVLAFAYQLAGQLDAWQQQLNAELESAADPDARAAWLLLQSYAQEIESARWDPLAGHHLILQAMQTAESAPMQREVVRWYVWRLIEARQLDEAGKILTEHQSLFEAEEADQTVWKKLHSQLSFAQRTPQRDKTRKRAKLASQLQQRIEQLEHQLDGMPDGDGQAMRQEVLALLRDYHAALTK